MLIQEELLVIYGAIFEKYELNDEIFTEGSFSKYYFQIRTGIVHLNNYDEDGREFTQQILSDGESIGESFLIGELPYTVNAVAKSRCEIIKISKTTFTKILNENPEISLRLFKQVADKLSDKYYLMITLISQDPMYKVEYILNHLKKTSDFHRPYSYEVPLTRQQLANLTGLRVETVIRTVKKLEKNNKIKIRSKRIFC
ncbi:Crp/Fnr family transcriptional regulator [Chryseobacterium indoltheticum]|uniref:cAMP regulatory protein n=1 Tax=Chryseobacterium indoltheticum TaxID=254 RepID=A0A381FIM5_9FLAO|nr:Crp/Fnr family transcriptional regulator [Chryseobacterium indoltheticum]SUX46002.1 cAMP regulatory protein [Chryseobacterium indoltheticum]